MGEVAGEADCSLVSLFALSGAALASATMRRRHEDDIPPIEHYCVMRERRCYSPT